MTISNILFLDIDGVVVTFRSHLGHGKPSGMMKDFDPMVMGMLKFLCNKVNAKIVISSTWRLYEGLEASLREQFEKNEMTDLLHSDWFTPDFRYDKTSEFMRHSGTPYRGEEIKAWLALHPEVTKYQILDDDSDMLPEQLPYFKHTEAMNGLKVEQVWAMRDFFLNETSVVV